MEYQTLFWVLVTLLALQILGIYAVGQSIKTLLTSEKFKERLLRKEESDNELGKKILSLIVLIALGSASNYALAESPIELTEGAISGNDSIYNRISINVLLAINIMLAAVLIYMRGLFKSLFKAGTPQVELANKKRKRRLRINKILTDAIPLSEEESILLNHDYDGITELDNNLPPWWKWGFYLTIVVGIIYLTNFHILKISPLQAEEYELSIIEAEEEVAAYLKDQALNVDESTVVFLDGESDLNEGKSIYTQYCVVCHLDGGAGLVGPNLADDYWLYGDDIASIFKTIKYGANNGMKSWKDELNPVQIQQVSSYIKSLRGTNPANAKDPEGDFYSTEKTEVEVEANGVEHTDTTATEE